MDDLQAAGLDLRHVGCGRSAGGFKNLDALFDADFNETGIVEITEGGKKSEVDRKGLIGQCLALFDFFTKLFLVLEAGGSHNAEAARVGNRGNKLSSGKTLHCAEEDGVLDTEHFGDLGLDNSCHDSVSFFFLIPYTCTG